MWRNRVFRIFNILASCELYFLRLQTNYLSAISPKSGRKGLSQTFFSCSASFKRGLLRYLNHLNVQNNFKILAKVAVKWLWRWRIIVNMRMLKFYTLPYLCCNATSPRVRIWATSSCVGQSPAATQPKTPHSSPIPDSSNSIFISLSVNLTDRGSSVSAISACRCVSARRQQGSNTCHSKWRSLKLHKLNWNRLSCC